MKKADQRSLSSKRGDNNLKKSRQHASALLCQIEKLSKHPRGAIADLMLQRFIDLFLTSTASKAVALAKADPKRAITDDLFNRAERLDVLAPFGVRVPWRLQPRKSGPPRCVVSLPWELNAVHRLAADLIYAQVEAGQHIFQWPGRGRDRLALTLEYLLENYGQHVLLADVRQCFASVNVDAIAALNLLPPELVRNALDYRSLRFRRYDPPAGVPVGMEDVEPTAPRGLLEGSAASNPLLATLFNDLPSHLNQELAPLVFGDNIAIVASSEEARSHAEKDLVRYFADHLAGPFSLKLERYGPNERFEMLGYGFEREPDGSASIEYADRNWVRVQRELYRHPDVRSWGDAEKITTDLLAGFPAVSERQRELLFMMVSDELNAAELGTAG